LWFCFVHAVGKKAVLATKQSRSLGGTCSKTIMTYTDLKNKNRKIKKTLRLGVLRVFEWAVCNGALNLTCLHCLQHFFLESLFNLYCFITFSVYGLFSLLQPRTDYKKYYWVKYVVNSMVAPHISKDTGNQCTALFTNVFNNDYENLHRVN